MRRAVVDPLFVPLALLLAVVLAVTAVLAVPFGPRRRVSRSASLAAAYLLVDVSLLLACAVLWLRRPRRRDAEAERRWADTHARLLRWALERLMVLARATVGFRVELAADAPSLPDDDRPAIVLARHAGPGDSFALAWLIFHGFGRTPRIVLKDFLQWDPGLDVVLTRLSGCFLPSGPVAGDDDAERIGAAAAGLGRGDALLLFPEGGNWTPARHRRAVGRLWRSRRYRAARRAAAMPLVLPPRPAGTAAALAARPDVDVVVVAHAGLDRLTSVREIWAAMPLGAQPMRVQWWRVAADDVPRAAEEVEEWLNGQWAAVARWVAAVPSPEPPSPAPMLGAIPPRGDAAVQGF